MGRRGEVEGRHGARDCLELTTHSFPRCLAAWEGATRRHMTLHAEKRRRRSKADAPLLVAGAILSDAALDPFD